VVELDNWQQDGRGGSARAKTMLSVSERQMEIDAIISFESLIGEKMIVVDW